MTTEALVPQESALAVQHELSVEQVIARINKVHEVMKRAMQEGHHYGVIPGTPKPSLWKPGAELLCVMFRLDPQYVAQERREPDDHLTVTTTCTLWHIPTGQRAGSGMGSCSTRESKYAYRQASRVCPKCGQPAIIKGKEEYGGGWMCFKKKDGCGAKFADEDAAITGQVTGRVANEDLPDQENTVLKMSNKRALVAAVLNVTAASDIFTQDIEDMPHLADSVQPAKQESHAGPESPSGVRGPEGSQAPPAASHSESAEKDILLGRIQAGMDMLRLKAADQMAIWTKHCGTAKFVSQEADVSALGDLLAELQTTFKAKK
ncbi:MAG: hypothetical protein Q8R78_05850 [Candidatus Omnitrophota bacterium]|nr:hypothetical protein [Candidatus Omnitrophota bacterium]